MLSWVLGREDQNGDHRLGAAPRNDSLNSSGVITEAGGGIGRVEGANGKSDSRNVYSRQSKNKQNSSGAREAPHISNVHVDALYCDTNVPDLAGMASTVECNLSRRQGEGRVGNGRRKKDGNLEWGRSRNWGGRGEGVFRDFHRLLGSFPPPPPPPPLFPLQGPANHAARAATPHTVVTYAWVLIANLPRA